MTQHSVQSADLALTMKSFSLSASVKVTPAGLLAIAALVAGVLLSTAAVVAVAKR